MQEGKNFSSAELFLLNTKENLKYIKMGLFLRTGPVFLLLVLPDNHLEMSEKELREVGIGESNWRKIKSRTWRLLLYTK